MKKSSVYKLDPFIDEKGLLIVEGRLTKVKFKFTQYSLANRVASLD